MIPDLKIFVGDALENLRSLPSESVNLCVTSPPYFGLRDYGMAGQIGVETTPDDYIAKLTAVFEEVRRVLKPDGNFYMNLGDSYAGSGRGGNTGNDSSTLQGSQDGQNECRKARGSQKSAGLHELARQNGSIGRAWVPPPPGMKQKNLIGIPWRAAFALQSAGWWLREDIIWAKANCMPESVRDRCTRSHEYIFHFTKSANYFYDADAIKEPCIYDVDGTGTAARKARAKENHKAMPTAQRAGIRPGGFEDCEKFDGKNGTQKQRGHGRRHDGFNDRWDKMEKEEQCTGMRNKRSVWTISPAQYPEAHFATYPVDLIKPMILAGSRPGDTVLDPFAGSGTTGQVAIELGRSAILIELNPEYAKLCEQRCRTTPGLNL